MTLADKNGTREKSLVPFFTHGAGTCVKQGTAVGVGGKSGALLRERTVDYEAELIDMLLERWDTAIRIMTTCRQKRDIPG